MSKKSKLKNEGLPSGKRAKKSAIPPEYKNDPDMWAAIQASLNDQLMQELPFGHTVPGQDPVPLKKNGQPDMRFKVNKQN